MEKNHKEETIRKVGKYFFFMVWSILFLLALVQNVEAAELYISPSQGAYTVGDTFSISVFVSIKDQTMNAADGIVNFPSSHLEVISISKVGSIFSLWVLEPSFSNNKGTVQFEGIVLNPGFSGSGGKIITVMFKAKAAGVVNLTLSSSSVLAHDGQGTNILKQVGNARLTIQEKQKPSVEPSEVPKPQEPQEKGPQLLPKAPIVSSSTNPDSTKWYPNNKVILSWSVDPDIIGVNILADREPKTDPGTKSDGLIRSYTYTDVDDGIWYFHIKLYNGLGWGPTTHFKFQIDTIKPERFDIRQTKRTDLTDPQVKFIFKAEDATSGINNYEVSLDNGESIALPGGKEYVYETPVLSSGQHTILAKVVDEAGNFLYNSQDFSIESLVPPTFTEFPRVLKPGDPLVITGTTYPNAQVTFWLQKDKDEPTKEVTKSDNIGSFTIVHKERLKKGIYTGWADIQDARGAVGTSQEKITFVVEEPQIVRVGASIVVYFSIFIPLIALIFFLLFLLWYSWHSLQSFKRRIRKEVQVADHTLHKAFSLLRKEIHTHLLALEKTKTKRDLTKEEKKMEAHLKKSLEESEQLLHTELEVMEKEIQ